MALAKYAIHRVIRADTRLDAIESSKNDFWNATVVDKVELQSDLTFKNLYFDYLVIDPEKDDHKTLVVVLDENHEIDFHRLEILTKVAQLRVYRRLPFRQRWSKRAQFIAFGGSSGLIVLISMIAGAVLNVSNSVKTFTELSARKGIAGVPPKSQSLLVQTPSLAPAMAPEKSVIPGQITNTVGTSTVTPGAAEARPASQLQAVSTVQPRNLTQAIQAYVADQISQYQPANKVAPRVKFWSPPDAFYDRRSETAHCELDASVEGDKLSLPRRSFGPSSSGEGSTPEEITESACRHAADSLISSFRAQN